MSAFAPAPLARSTPSLDRESLIDLGVTVFFLLFFLPIGLFGPLIGLPPLLLALVAGMITFVGLDALEVRCRVCRLLMIVLCVCTLIVIAVVHFLAGTTLAPFVACVGALAIVLRARTLAAPR